MENSVIPKTRKWYSTLFLFVLVIFMFLLAIDLVGSSVSSMGQETVQGILLATSNPFIGLFMGLLATVLIQSSSTVTAMTVAVVSTGFLSLGSAIPIVMGANVGTTLTSTLVSLGFITNKNEFRKAISAGTVHDFFNILTVILVFPLEYKYGVLSKSANYLTQIFGGALKVSSDSSDSWMGISDISEAIVNLAPNAWMVLVLGLVMLFLSIKWLSNIIYGGLIGNSKDQLRKYIFASPYKSFGWGTLITTAIQSSSITTSLMVPLVASGRVTLKRAFPFIMGANIGTTITALIAAFNQSEAAISLAFVHLLFNLFGVLVFLPFPPIRKIPVMMAYKFGKLTLDSRIIGLSYIVFTFFLLPFTLIYINKDSALQKTYTYEINDGEGLQTGVIIFNAEGLNADLRYLLYEDFEDVEGFSVPDTSYLLPKNAESFITPRLSINYAELQEKFNVSVEDVTYHNGTITLGGLRSLELTDSTGTTTVYLFDAENHILIESHTRNALGDLIESIKLISIN